MWGDALDLSSTSTSTSSTYQVVFHYTNFLAFKNITNEAGKGTSASLNFLVILYVGIIIKNSPNIWVAYHYRLLLQLLLMCH